MSSDLFLMEVAAWTVSLVPSVTVPEIGGIVKFLNFKPFEFFRQVSSSEINGKNTIYHIRRNKSALFRCSFSELHHLLATVPLYVVITHWSQEDENMEYSQKLVGVVHVSLVKLSPEEPRANEDIDHLEIRTISGLFPVRDLLGRAVGQIHMRIQLTEMNCPLHVDSSGEQLLQQSAMRRSTPVQSIDLRSGKTAREYPRMKTFSGVAISMPARRYHSLEAVLTRRYEATDDRPNNVKGASESTSSTCSRQDALISCRISDQGQEFRAKGGSVQRPELQFSHHTAAICCPNDPVNFSPDSGLATKSPIPSEMEAQSGQVLANDVLPRCMPNSPNIANIPPHFEVESHSHSSDNGLPVLKSLFKELQSLRSRKGRSRYPQGSELDIVYSILSSTHSPFQMKTGSNRGSLPTGRHRICTESPLELKNKSAVEHRRRVSQMSMHVRRQPPPGCSVPKNRGWLRSTPVYKGPQKPMLMPRANHTHMLRLQQLRLREQKKCRSPSHNESRSVSVLKLNESKSKRSGPQSERSEVTDPTPSQQENCRQTTQRSRPVSLNSHRIHAPVGRTLLATEPVNLLGEVEPESPKRDEQNGITACASLANSATSPRHESPHNCRRSFGRRIVKLQPSNRSTSTEDCEIVQAVVSPGSKEFTNIRPRRSGSSPKTKYVALTRALSHPVQEELKNIDSVSGIMPINHDNSPIEEVPEISHSSHSSFGCSKHSTSLFYEGEPDVTEQTRSESRTSQIISLMYMSQSSDTQSLGSEPVKLNNQEIGFAEEELDDETEYPKPISKTIAPTVVRITSEEHTDVDRTHVLPKVISSVGESCRGSGSPDAPSFTGGKGQLNQRTRSPSTEDDSVETVLSESDCEQLDAHLNEGQLVQLPELEFPVIKDQAIQEAVEDMIEAMRSRGSHNYIVGGTAL